MLNGIISRIGVGTGAGRTIPWARSIGLEALAQGDCGASTEKVIGAKSVVFRGYIFQMFVLQNKEEKVCAKEKKKKETIKQEKR